jgi:hypothetical protein
VDNFAMRRDNRRNPLFDAPMNTPSLVIEVILEAERETRALHASAS